MRNLHPTPAQVRKDHPRHAVEASATLRQAFWRIIDAGTVNVCGAASQMKLSRTALIRAVGTRRKGGRDFGRCTRKVLAKLTAWVAIKMRKKR